MLGATRTSGASPGGSSTSGWGTSKGIGPVTCTAGGPGARVLELRVGGDQRQVGADAAVEAVEGREAHALALAVQVPAPVLEADVERPLPGPPDRPPDRRARLTQSDREEGQARLDHRVDVGDQGGERHPGRLGGEGRGEGEDVGDDDRRVEALEQRQQRPRRVGGVLSLLGLRLGRREGAVFLGRGEVEPGALDRGAALLPGLDRHRVPAARQRPSQGDRREDVAGVAERGDQ